MNNLIYKVLFNYALQGPFIENLSANSLACIVCLSCVTFVGANSEEFRQPSREWSLC